MWREIGIPLALVLLGCQLNLLAQVSDSCSLELKGQIIDHHDNSELAYSTILILELGSGTVADENGIFSIEGLCRGKYTVQYSHVGCETADTIIELYSDKSIRLYLEHHLELLRTIEVHGDHLDGPASQSREELSGNQLAEMQGKSLGESLADLPGVSVLQTGPTVFKPLIQGMYGSRIAIFQEGVRLEGQDWGLDHAPEVDPFSGDRLTVVKGAGAVEYGVDAIGGVILIDRQEAAPDSHLHGRANLSIGENGRSGALAVKLSRQTGPGEFHFLGSGRRAGDLHTPDYNLTNTGMAEFSVGLGLRRQISAYQVKLNYNLFVNNLGVMRSSHIGNLTDLEAALTADRPAIVEPFSYSIGSPRQEVLHHTLNVEAGRDITGLGQLDFQYSLQVNDREEYDIRRGDRSDKPALDLRLISQKLGLKLRHKPLVSGLPGLIGLGWSYKDNTNIPGTGVRPLVPDYLSMAPYVFIIEKWGWKKSLIELGIRYEYQWMKAWTFDQLNVLTTPEFHYHNVAANAGVVFRPGESLSYRTNLGLASRAPNVHELFSEGLHHGAAAIEIGSRDLEPEQSVKWMHNLTFSKGKFHLGADLYGQYFKGYIFLQPRDEPELTIRGAFPVFDYLQADALLLGTDLSANIQLPRGLDVKLQYSLIRGRNRDIGDWLIYMPADRVEAALGYRHGPDSDQSPSFGAEIRYAYSFKQVRLPVQGDLIDAPDGYGLLGLKLRSRISLGEMPLNIVLTLSNAMNLGYREYLNRLRYFADEPGRNIELQFYTTF